MTDTLFPTLQRDVMQLFLIFLASYNIFICFQIEYQKQKSETIDNYQGFQKLDSKDHPVVQQGIKAAEITSNASNFDIVLSYIWSG